MTRGPGRLLLNVVVVALCALLLAPIVIVVIASFSGDAYLKFPPESLSLRWYQRFLTDDRWLNALWNSLAVAAMACVFSTALGFLTAYAMVRGRFPMRRAITSMILMPLIVPHVVTAIALYFLSARLGMIGVKPWIAVAHTVVALPVVYVILRAAIHTVDPNLEKAAMICGCTRAQVFTRVALPLTTPSIVSAMLFGFLASFDELVISLFLAGIRAETLPVRIWNSLLLEVEPTIAAVSSLLIAATVVVIVLDRVIRRAVRI